MSLDTSFGDGGIVFSNIVDASYNYINSIQTYNDKIIISGYSSDASGDRVFIASYNSNGTLDTSFGVNGYIYPENYYSFSSPNSKTIIVLSTGIIILSCLDNSNVINLLFYNSNGTLNKQINTSYTANNVYFSSILKYKDSDNFVLTFNVNNSYWYYRRYDSNGDGISDLIQTNFDNNSSNYFCLCNTIDYSNNIIFGGRQNLGPGATPNLHMFEVFGSDDTNIIGLTSYASGNNVTGYTSTTTDTSNNIILVGNFSNYFLVRKYDSSGNFITMNNTILGNAYTSDVVIDTNGKIIISLTKNIGDYDSLYLVKLNSDLTLDTTFGNNGTILTDISNNDFEVRNIFLQSDGKILTSATFTQEYYDASGEYVSEEDKYVILRYLNSSIPNTDPDLSELITNIIKNKKLILFNINL